MFSLIKIWQSAALGKFIPGAGELAIVAAVNAVADQRAQRLVDGPRVLDRQIRNAAPRIELVRPHDGLRGAQVHAGGALAAMTAHR